MEIQCNLKIIMKWSARAAELTAVIADLRLCTWVKNDKNHKTTSCDSEVTALALRYMWLEYLPARLVLTSGSVRVTL